MTGRLEGKVAFITGAARGQGRSHAVRLAQEGADIIAVDICENIDTVTPFYPLATEDELAETAAQVEALDRRIFARRADVRDLDQLQAVFDEGVAELGRVDIVVANAGIATYGLSWELTSQQWKDMIDVNLTGVFHTAKVAIPSLIEAGNGGSIVFTSSIGGLKGIQHVAHYVAAKHGIVGLMRTMANELGQYKIRVNTVHPTNVDTIMIQNPGTYSMFAPGDPEPTQDKAMAGFMSLNTLPVPWIDPVDISNAVLYLSSDEGRYVTGVTLPVDAGAYVK
ncbi:SDR family mycofactocin-dependent oxidoreductase [Rhodococcus sp. 06-156-3C]|uniref:mycofactocin-coupled SDR family oxidoreductase n=1 Tax=Nocardiaceae TaxID=85025 RepID=UPI000522FDFE|nr:MULTISPECIES: mycofactocin-coupled SDR family oxidoreductase [Rhodococcus]OZD15106.1 SDR family mycofactocin-dependent oxidoreductase [Rhodococcus sp. 06-156-4C]OZD19809.1 SDR family mycofactocin-dependent oxidoreductase [Rhodococcus sp. 06-156-4a]OZD22882.1 SDR family mycofactocin-dependent oxidoreductase [Rhodococcus sp. 06-156-3C]OZD25827.1 SDR family mycofactocin-dependent oxidoreductase [Rhodococcus sp. 06-156-3b]OZD38033.1 SDR family mycofactocin-dependent oxidoreductase [Rhodococcus 